MLARGGPDGLRIYAIGDVHGRLDLLELMFERIDADRARHPGRAHVEIALGDLIDRGPDSKGVIDLCIARKASRGLTALRGNHDQYMLGALSGPAGIGRWLDWGGVEALASYGVVTGDPALADHAVLARAMPKIVPEAHQAFLRAMPLSIRHGDLFFAHAGIRPGVPLEDQSAEDLTTIREPFQSDPRDHGVIVVHGHTPMDAPIVRTNRIGVDTRAYESGVLTAAVIEGMRLSFLTITGARGHYA